MGKYLESAYLSCLHCYICTDVECQLLLIGTLASFNECLHVCITEMALSLVANPTLALALAD